MKCFTRTFAVACLFAGAAQAAGFDLPGQVSWTTFANEPLVHDQAVAIGAALKDAAGVDLRIEPANTDTARTDLLRTRQVDFSATAVGGSGGQQEGAFDFAGQDWGPQKVRLVLAELRRADPLCDRRRGVISGAQALADLQGKRVAWYRISLSSTSTPRPILPMPASPGTMWAGRRRRVLRRCPAGSGGRQPGRRVRRHGHRPAVYDAAAGPRGLFWPAIDAKMPRG